MFYDLGKRFFLLLINVFEFLRIFLVFLSFFTILYWLIQLGGGVFPDFISAVFEGIKNLTHVFYQRTVTVENTTIDFSFLIATFAMLFISYCLKFVIEQVKSVEETFDKAHKIIEKKKEDLYNVVLEKQYLYNELKTNNALILINFSAQNLAKNAMYDKDVKAGVDEKRREVLLAFAKNIHLYLKCEKTISKSGLLIYCDDVNEIDAILAKINSIITALKSKYLTQKWQINSFITLEVYAQDEKGKKEDLIEKLKNLTMLTKLNFENETVCLASFKQRYSLIKDPKYIIDAKGIYNVAGAKEAEVFSVEILR